MIIIRLREGRNWKEILSTLDKKISDLKSDSSNQPIQRSISLMNQINSEIYRLLNSYPPENIRSLLNDRLLSREMLLDPSDYDGSKVESRKISESKDPNDYSLEYERGHVNIYDFSHRFIQSEDTIEDALTAIKSGEVAETLRNKYSNNPRTSPKGYA